MSPLLKLTNIRASYGKIRVLNGITCAIEEGEIVAFLGSNGAGKSTFLKAIAGSLRPIEGTIVFNGRDISSLSAHQITRAGIVLVPESRALFSDMTVEENLEMGAFTLKGSTVIKRAKDSMFEIFPVLRRRVNQIAGTLSGGEQQQLAIARGLISDPKILMLDELSLGLAPKLVEEVYEVIENIFEARGTTIVVVEQNITMALKVSQRGYIFENGKIAIEGDATSLLSNAYVKKVYLGSW